MQQTEEAASCCSQIASSAAGCLSRLQSLISSASQYIMCSRSLRFITGQNQQHPYMCFVVKLVTWLLLWAWFISGGFGAVFLILSLICFVWVNTGTRPRQPGELSAYSVFNRNCERIDGTFTAEQFEDQLRHGSLM